MIQANRLFKQFQARGRRLQAVNDVTFHVHAGEVYGLLGPNGAGKTTTLRMVMGLLEPDSGTIEIGPPGEKNGTGLKVGSDDYRRMLGLISTNDGVYPWLTVQEMLLYFADLYAVPIATAKERVLELTRQLGIDSVLDQRCSTLSTGQKQRVILARGLMHDPPVMLLDEPTRGLDVVGSQTIFKFIEFLKTNGKAVLLSTHRLDEAERVCDRFGLLHQGLLRYEGTLQDLRDATGKNHLTDMFIDLIQPPAREPV